MLPANSSILTWWQREQWWWWGQWWKLEQDSICNSCDVFYTIAAVKSSLFAFLKYDPQRRPPCSYASHRRRIWGRVDGSCNLEKFLKSTIYEVYHNCRFKCFSWGFIRLKHRKNCECCHHHSLFKGHNVIVHIVVLNCQKCNQCLKCHVSGHKNWNHSENIQKLSKLSKLLKIV